MANVYALPPEIKAPEPDYKDMDNHDRREEAFCAELKAWCLANGSGKLCGEIISSHIADGQAQYMVISERPLDLFHLPLGDAYSMGAVWERGLRIADVRQMVERRKGLAELFGGTKKTNSNEH